MKEEYSFVFLPDGRFVQSFAGPIPESFGCDGTTFWRIDCSRGVQRLDFEDRDRAMALSILLASVWLRPDAPV